MTKKFSALLTTQGNERLAAAALNGVPLGITQMAVGDGGGTLPTPNAEQTGLVNEMYRAPLNRLIIADQAANVIRAEMVMPPQTGGFWLREAALFDDDGVCLAVANLPESYKPKLAEGSGRFQVINIWLMVSSTADIQLTADPSVIIATVDEVNKAKNNAKDYADEVAGELERELQKAIKDAVAQALRDAWEDENPPGTVRFFNKNINPNERWPHSRWVYTGENHSIRVGAADGSNVGTTGGRDSVSIGKNNLPAVQIGVSGETDDTDLGRKSTEEAGAFNPITDSRFNKLSAKASDIDGLFTTGDQDDRNPADEYRVAGMSQELWAASVIRPTPDHKHDINLGKHKHAVSGKTDNLGSGETISVVESHILLMCWARVA
ncbi:phage tail protein [Pluralibacter gergoviae]|uniref:phage tail protein n=1 Tax=Pluralibacter gergoviae TaxID=61647 RepID=UPI002FD881CB